MSEKKVEHSSHQKRGKISEKSNKARIAVFFGLIAIIIILIILLFIPNIFNGEKSVSMTKSEKNTLQVYEKAIDLIVDANKASMTEDKYISIETSNLLDIDSGNPITEREVEALKDYMKKYNSIVYLFGYDELKKNYSDENGNFLGSLITVNVRKSGDSSLVLNLACHKEEGDVWMEKRYATLKDGEWVIK